MNFIIEELEYKHINIADFQESLNRAKALADNIETIEKITGMKYLYNMAYDIVVKGSDYADEFTLVRHGNIEEKFYLEILNSKSAEENEKEEIRGGCVIGVHDTDNYKLGETVQTYTQIGDTDYWYREL